MNTYIVAGAAFLAGVITVLLLKQKSPENPQEQYIKNKLFGTLEENQKGTANTDLSYTSSSGAARDESGQYEVYLVAVGPDKIGAIKAIREVTNLGLKEAKDLVESRLPVRIAGTNSKQQAYLIKQQLEQVRCVAGIKDGETEIL
ncbi:MAG: ribosomal protein L7/L12 [Candidatus Saccharibacteria bacterium]